MPAGTWRLDPDDDVRDADFRDGDFDDAEARALAADLAVPFGRAVVDALDFAGFDLPTDFELAFELDFDVALTASFLTASFLAAR